MWFWIGPEINIDTIVFNLKKIFIYFFYLNRYFKTTCFLLLFSCPLHSQNAKLDSLKQLLSKAPEDTTKANLMIEITRAYLYGFNDRDAMQDYSEKNLVLSKKLNYKKGIAYSYNYLGIVRWGKGDLDIALNYYKNALALMREIKDLRGESSSLGNIGYIYNDKGDYALAVEYTIQATKIKEQVNDKRGMIVCYNNLGTIYLNQSNYKEAILSHVKSMKLSEEMSDSMGIGSAYINIAQVLEAQNKWDEALQSYKNGLPLLRAVGDKYGVGVTLNSIGNVYMSKKNYEAALDNYTRSLSIRKECNDKQGQAECYNGIGKVYLEKKKYKEALECQLQSLRLQELTGTKKGRAVTYLYLGEISEAMKNYPKAVEYYKKALAISTEINSRDAIRDSYQYLASVYEKLQDDESALKYLNLYYAQKDSLLNKENFKQIYEINTRYQTEKKQNEIELLTKDQVINEKTLKQQKIIRIALLVGLVLVCILLFSVYARYRFKQKANLLLEQQKREIQEQNVLITDSIDYAKTIQEAILPSNKRVKEFFPQSFVLYKPKATVSGDFYWIGQKEEKTICIVADCTGHGVPGAFMSLLGFNMLDNIVEKEYQQPSFILNTLNSEMVAAMTQEQFITSSVKHGMDAAVISVDKKAMQLQYAGAHNSLYHIRSGQLTEIKADKQAIGSFKESEQITFTNHILTIEKGDVFYMFSDGFPDQIGGPNRKKFYYPPFKELLISIHHLDMEEQKIILDKTITDWRGERDQTDDILVMGIRI
jgi:serine phosphatase RsbU (regulator of sigma subunit)